MNNISLSNLIQSSNVNDSKGLIQKGQPQRGSLEKKDFSDALQVAKQQNSKTVDNEDVKVTNKEETKVDSEKTDETSDKDDKETNKTEDSLEELLLLLQQLASLLEEKKQADSINDAKLAAENSGLNLGLETKNSDLKESILKLLKEKLAGSNDANKNSQLEQLLGNDKAIDGNGLLALIDGLIGNSTEGKTADSSEMKILSSILGEMTKDQTTSPNNDILAKLNGLLMPIVNEAAKEQNSENALKKDVTLLKDLVDKLSANNSLNDEIKTQIQELKALLSSEDKIDKAQLNSILSGLINAKDKATTEKSGNNGNVDFVSAARNKNTQYKSISEGSTSQSREGKILENITKDNIDKTDTKISKVGWLMGSLNNISNQSDSIEASSFIPTVNKATVVQDVIKSIKYMELNNMKELTVKMNPKNLGEMAIKITTVGGNLSASITVKDRDVYNTINSNLNDIKAALNSQNIKVNEVSVNIYNDQSNFYNQSFGESGFNQRQENGDGRKSTATNDLLDEDSVQAEEEVSLGSINMLA